MDFLLPYLTVTNVVYAVLGIPALVGFAVLLRLSRKERLSFSQRHNVMDARIKQTAHDVEELNKTMQREEQLHIVATALREAISLPHHLQNIHASQSTAMASVEESAQRVTLSLEKYYFYIEYKENKKSLRSTGKTVYGQGHFEVFGPLEKEHAQKEYAQTERAQYEDREKNNEENTAEKALKPVRVFHNLLELELYLTQKIHQPQGRKLPPALRPR